MTPEKSKRMKHLVEQIEMEKDPTRFNKLIQDLLELLDSKNQPSLSERPPTSNSSKE